MKYKSNEPLGTLNVSKKLHARVRIFCNKYGLRIRYWLEKTVSDALDEKEGK